MWTLRSEILGPVASLRRVSKRGGDRTSDGVAEGRSRTAGHLLALIRCGHGLTREELLRQTELTRARLTSRLDLLLTAGLVLKRESGVTTAGRRARLLAFNPDAGAVLVAHLRSHATRVGIMDLDGTPVRSSSVRGIAIAGWFAARRGTPAIIDRDLPFKTWAEYEKHLYSLDHVLYVEVGEEVSAAIVTDRRLDRGAPGEIGHVRVTQAHGRPCHCGNVGCLATVTREAAVIVDLEKPGAHEATGALRKAGDALGQVLQNLVDLLDPQAVVLGGDPAMPVLVDAAREAVNRNCSHPPPPILAAQLQGTAAMGGRGPLRC